jgi:alpha-beta hydrolase superfamily lysophospholipase
MKEDEMYFADEDGWELVVDDLNELTKRIKQENPDLPVFLFGHSMGSFLSRRYIQKYGEGLSGVILSGTGGDPGILGSIGVWVAKQEIKKRGKKGKSKLLNKLSFGSYNKAFKPNRTEFDWLSRDEKEVDKYIEDPYCGEVATAGFFYDMLVGIKLLDKPERLRQVPKDLPVLIFSGDKDPVGQNSRGVLKTYRNFQMVGIKDVDCKLYQGGRHEMLNEINKDEVFSDVVDWLHKRS